MPKRFKISYAQRALPFDGTRSRTLREPLKREWQALSISGFLLLSVMLFYGYSVVNSIAQVAARESALKEVRVLAAERAVLEEQYLAKARGITEVYATRRGFSEPTERVFVTRAAPLTYASDAR